MFLLLRVDIMSRELCIRLCEGFTNPFDIALFSDATNFVGAHFATSPQYWVWPETHFV